TLNIASQRSSSMVAGDISLNGGNITGAGSRVNLVSVKWPGKVQLDATNLNTSIDVSQFTAMGTIRLTNLALIDTSGPAGGPISIYGGSLNVDSSLIFSNTTGALSGAPLDIVMRQDVNISGSSGIILPPPYSDSGLSNSGVFAGILTGTVASGRGGDVSIKARSITIDPSGNAAHGLSGINTLTLGTATGN